MSAGFYIVTVAVVVEFAIILLNVVAARHDKNYWT